MIADIYIKLSANFRDRRLTKPPVFIKDLRTNIVYMYLPHE